MGKTRFTVPLFLALFHALLPNTRGAHTEGPSAELRLCSRCRCALSEECQQSASSAYRTDLGARGSGNACEERQSKVVKRRKEVAKGAAKVEAKETTKPRNKPREKSPVQPRSESPAKPRPKSPVKPRKKAPPIPTPKATAEAAAEVTAEETAEQTAAQTAEQTAAPTDGEAEKCPLPYGCKEEDFTLEITTKEQLTHLISRLGWVITQRKAYIGYFYFMQYMRGSFKLLETNLWNLLQETAVKNNISEKIKKKMWEPCKNTLTREQNKLEKESLKNFSNFMLERSFSVSFIEKMLYAKETNKYIYMRYYDEHLGNDAKAWYDVLEQQEKFWTSRLSYEANCHHTAAIR
ncbi:RAD protein [Plasmodium vivax]|uniref:RAD protein (Pv-fam-e) n=3 Tax=Plasmodium vivax TaxID=5855 RepID=A0A0J9WES6_PLAVI|nr:RAD protein (Pv-fam-e) [Plasmodium vivax North Korean]CAG9479799.1 unnamed protein product [Plasmodium vivax]SCO65886.1 RAD protein [Plasmodium vivax]SCO71314.1 RAD protein [Plasmodium vivax]VUZ94050.1 Plasmodium exported protein (PHIST), unknown function [Plasmodium vivax]